MHVEIDKDHICDCIINYLSDPAVKTSIKDELLNIDVKLHGGKTLSDEDISFLKKLKIF